MADIILQRPEAGQVTTITPQTGDRINLEFSADEALLARDGDNLIFSFEDGSSIELTNFYTAYSSENMPEFVIEGAIIPGEAFFAALGEELMPAAGNTSAPSGSGSGVGTESGTLHGGVESLGGTDQGGEEDAPGETVYFSTAPNEPVTDTNDNNNTEQDAPDPIIPSTPDVEETPREVVGTVTIREKNLEDGTDPNASLVTKEWTPPAGYTIDESFVDGVYEGEYGETYQVSLVDGKLQFTLLTPADNPTTGETSEADHWVSSNQVNITLVDQDGESKDVSVSLNVQDDGPAVADFVVGTPGNYSAALTPDADGVVDLSAVYDFGADGSGIYKIMGAYTNHKVDEFGNVEYKTAWGVISLNESTGEMTYVVNDDYTGPTPTVKIYATDSDGDIGYHVNVTLPIISDNLPADAGSTLTGNLFNNDTFLPAGVELTEITPPSDDWEGVLNDDGSVTLNYNEGEIILTIQPDGTYELETDISHVNTETFTFNYQFTASGQEYSASLTVGNASTDNLHVGLLQGDSAVVTDVNTGSEYTQNFGDYSSDSDSGNHHVNGIMLGQGSDTITVDSAIGSQGNLNYADAKGEDTFIYGDALDNTDQNQVGDDVINIGTLDGTKVRADGNLYDGVEGGNDTVNVENMEHGSIIADGWHLNAGSKGGDDEVNVGTMQSGEIYGDGKSIHSTAEGGDDQINVDVIDTTAAGTQSVIIDAGSGNDTVTVGDINQGSGDSIKIDGGLGDADMFNYDSAEDNTVAFKGDNIFIAGNNAQITNFEGVGTGGGDDLIKVYEESNVDFNDIVVDAGEGMDVLLAGTDKLTEITDMIDSGNLSNTEMVVLSDSLNDSSTTSTNDLFNKLEDDGVTQDANGQFNFDDSWSKSENAPSGYDMYTSTDNSGNDMTILVAQTQLSNTPS